MNPGSKRGVRLRDVDRALEGWLSDMVAPV